MANGRCRLHGGLTPAGAAHPAFIHGRYSKYLPTRLSERYRTAATDPDLLALGSEVALLDARLAELVERTNATEAGVVWAEIVQLVEQRRRLVESERRRLVDLQQYLTAEQALGLITAITASVRRHVHDREALRAISADVARISSA